MPARKKSTRSKSSSGAAKAAEAAREAELQGQATAREFVCDNEALLRRQLNEEEHAAFEATRFQEAEARHTTAQSVSQAQFEAREHALTVELQQKTEALQTAQATLIQLQQAGDMLETEKASALRRVALLSNELELAQVNAVESERRAASADHGHQDALRKLEDEFDALQQKHHELTAQHAALEAQLPQSAPTATTAAPDNTRGSTDEANEETASVPAVPPSDAETAALLRVMQTEVERYKATATRLQEELTHARTEEEKSNLLVGVLNTQLESVREDNKRLHELSTKRQAETEAAGQVRREAQEARQAALTEMDHALSTASVRQRQLELEVDVHRTEAGKLSKELSALRDEHAALQTELAEVTQKAAQQAQSDLATNVAMQAELANQTKDLELALKAKAAAEDEKFNHKILTRAELDSLRTRLQRLQETMERKDREAFETIAVLRADASKQQTVHEQEAKGHATAIADLQTKLHAATSHREALQRELTELQSSSKQREQELYEELTSVTAHHSAAAEELERVRAAAAKKDAEYTHNFVCLTAERENLKTKLNEMIETAEQHRRTHAEIVGRMRAQTEELKAQLAADAEAQQSACAKETARADMAERNVRRLQDHVRDLEYNTHMGKESHGEAVKTLQAESRDLRSELSIAKRTIDRLETALGDLASHRQLCELNDRLTSELEKAQHTITALNGKVAVLKMEAETMGGFTVRKVQEEKEQLMRRLRQVEQRYRLMAPLFAQLRAFSESRLSPAIHPELFAALKTYDQETSFTPRGSLTGSAVDAEVQQTEKMAARVAAAAGASDGTTTIPAVMQPRPPSATAVNAKPRVTLRKPQSTRSSIVVTGVSAPVANADRLPVIA